MPNGPTVRGNFFFSNCRIQIFRKLKAKLEVNYRGKYREKSGRKLTLGVRDAEVFFDFS